MDYFDSHCHLQLSQFDEDREAALVRMQEHKTGGVVVGTDYAMSVAAVELAKQHDFLWAAVGLHPNDNADELFDSPAYEKLARDPKVVAIGECGLDYFRGGGTFEEKTTQRMRFEMQIELAAKVGKPLIIHCRDSQQRIANITSAHEEMLNILGQRKLDIPVIIHFFTGTGELAQKYVELGCYLSFPGPITYTDMYDQSILDTPMDRILSETDSPFAAPVPYRGKRNEPSYVDHVVAKIALIKEMDLPDVAAQIVQNSQKVFGVAG